VLGLFQHHWSLRSVFARPAQHGLNSGCSIWAWWRTKTNRLVNSLSASSAWCCWARAAVNRPRLLILDEPCQGLDAAQRWTLLAAVDRMVTQTGASLIFVTHHAKRNSSLHHACSDVEGRSGKHNSELTKPEVTMNSREDDHPQFEKLPIHKFDLAECV